MNTSIANIQRHLEDLTRSQIEYNRNCTLVYQMKLATAIALAPFYMKREKATLAYSQNEASVLFDDLKSHTSRSFFQVENGELDLRVNTLPLSLNKSVTTFRIQTEFVDEIMSRLVDKDISIALDYSYEMYFEDEGKIVEIRKRSNKSNAVDIRIQEVSNTLNQLIDRKGSESAISAVELLKNDLLAEYRELRQETPDTFIRRVQCLCGKRGELKYPDGARFI